MKTMKKILLSLLVVLSAVLFLPGAAQAKTKTESLGTSVKTFVKAAKKMDEKQLKKYVKNWAKYSVADIKDVMPKTYRAVKENASKVTYKVVSKEKKGDTATVVLQVRYPKYTKLVKRMIEAMNKYYEEKYGSANADMNVPDDLSGEEIKKLVKEMFGEIDSICAKQIKNCPKSGTASKKITVTFVKDGGRWVMKKMPESLVNAMFCDLVRSAKKAGPVPVV